MTKATECRNFVVAGHSGSGKTTLCELMLFKGGAIPRPGSVDAKIRFPTSWPMNRKKARASIPRS